MSRLRTYGAKRKFDKTTEPRPRRIKKTGTSRFCVQRHSARHLHYDLRFELDGVLVSFAVPKGPSMDPEEKRLAIHVEDHPLDYIDFEGVIPAGNYGAGTVEVFDFGDYEASPKDMREGLTKTGHLKFVLHGKKLNGAFIMVKLKGKKDNEWLLRKVADDAFHHAPPVRKKKVIMPDWINPMLALTADKAFDSSEWLFEVKWDGFRALAFLQGKKVKLWSRNQKLLNAAFPSLIDDLQELNAYAIFDGEIVVLDEKGISRFELLQECARNPHCLPHYMVFDVLFVDGMDVRALPLIKRKTLLKNLLASLETDAIRLSDYVEDTGTLLFEEAKKHGLEGLIAKRKQSPYVSLRSSDWLKIKAALSDEFVIAGFTAPKGQRQRFGSLVLGTYKNEVLQFVGHVGTGFSAKTIDDLFQKMKPLIRKTCPFKSIPKTNDKATWLRPYLTAEISFAEMTKQGILRQPVFQKLTTPVRSVEKAPKTIQTTHFSFVTNKEKIFWPGDNYTKGDMLTYYESISSYILPHLAGRPLTLRRYPDGILGADFYQKNVDNPPPFLKTVLIEHMRTKSKKENRQAVANDLQSLIYVANLGAIEMHPMLARAGNLTHPDFLVIDLDPLEVPFKKVVEVALSVHNLLEEIHAPHYLKTSGGKGLHIYVPLGGQLLFATSLRLAELIAILIRNRLPKLVSLERLPQHRKRRVYLDYVQNARGLSTVGPYSLRALPHAPVSTPLRWNEVTEKLDPLDFTIISVPKRLKKIGDIFAPVLSQSIIFADILEKLESQI